jgi:hypothetical protein
MKTLKTTIYAICIVMVLVLMSGTTKAQGPGGELSIGPRFGGSSGMSFKKHSASNKGALELIAGWNFDPNVEGLNLNVLYEKLAPLTSNRLSAMFGAGAGFAVWGDEFQLGLAGIIGFDYRVTKVINLQVDWQPTWYFINGSELSPMNAGFTIRYVLNNRKNRRN